MRIAYEDARFARGPETSRVVLTGVVDGGQHRSAHGLLQAGSEPRTGYGALAFDGTELLNEALIARAGLDAGQIEQGRLRTRQKVAQRVQRWRGARPFPDLAGRTAILVDDGLASGFTLMVTIKALRHHGAMQLVVAVPTAQADSAALIAARVEALYCANVRDGPGYAVVDA